MEDPDNIIPLRGTKPAKDPEPTKRECDQAIVQTLQYLVEEALKGNVIGIAFATLDPEGDVMTAWSSHSLVQLAGAITVLHHRYMSELTMD